MSRFKKQLKATANKAVPDKWEEIRKEVSAEIPAQSVTFKTPKYKYSRPIIATLSTCVIAIVIVFCTLILNHPSVNEPNQGKNSSNTEIRLDRVIWNQTTANISKPNETISISEEEWKANYQVPITSKYEWEYLIEKPSRKSVSSSSIPTMDGILSLTIGTDKQCTIYYQLHKDIDTTNQTISKIKDTSVVFSQEQEIKYAVFRQGEYTVIVECMGFQEQEMIDLIEDIIIK